jgi:hypothetical protein
LNGNFFTFANLNIGYDSCDVLFIENIFTLILSSSTEERKISSILFEYDRMITEYEVEINWSINKLESYLREELKKLTLNLISSLMDDLFVCFVLSLY